MKKTVCLLLLVMLLVPCCTGFASAEAEAIPFTPKLTQIITDAVDYSASDWFGSSYNRAMLTITLAADLSIQTGLDLSSLIDITTASFVGKESFTLVVSFYDQYGKLYTIFYAPVINTASYYSTYGLSGQETALQAVLRQNCSEGLYKNDIEQMMKALKDLQSILNS